MTYSEDGSLIAIAREASLGNENVTRKSRGNRCDISQQFCDSLRFCLLSDASANGDQFIEAVDWFLRGPGHTAKQQHAEQGIVKRPRVMPGN
jgi:hypothetical protein